MWSMRCSQRNSRTFAVLITCCRSLHWRTINGPSAKNEPLRIREASLVSSSSLIGAFTDAETLEQLLRTYRHHGQTFSHYLPDFVDRYIGKAGDILDIGIDAAVKRQLLSSDEMSATLLVEEFMDTSIKVTVDRLVSAGQMRVSECGASSTLCIGATHISASALWAVLCRRICRAASATRWWRCTRGMCSDSLTSLDLMTSSSMWLIPIEKI